MEHRPGYAGNILRVNLSSQEIETTPTEPVAMRFLGGRGIAAKIHWDEVSQHVDAYDPENRLVIMTGPVCGVPGFAGSRWQISGKSPILNTFSYSNLGGAWGAQLKFAGFDGLIIHGKAEKPVYLVIDDGKIEIKDASHLKGKGAISTREQLKKELGSSFRIVAVGAAGENRVRFATLLADSDSSGSSGLGAVAGSKNLKAVAVRGSGKVSVADKEAVRELRKSVRKIKFPPYTWPTTLSQDRMKKDICFGCIDGCIRVKYVPESGRPGKYACQSAGFYEVRAQRYYGRINEVPFMASALCNEYGLNTHDIEYMVMWLSRCYRMGVITEKESGLPISEIGSLEFIETLLRKIALREGFGDVLAEGTHRAAEIVGKDSGKAITDYMIKTGEGAPYGARLHLTTALLYAMEPRLPIQQLHEVGVPVLLWALRESGAGGLMTANAQDNYMTSDVIRGIAKVFWGDEIAGDFSTYEGKAVAAAKIQDRQYAKESLILCDFSWPILHSPITENHVGDPELESRICTAVTGMQLDEAGLATFGERAFNLQRAILVRETKGRREHDTVEEFNFTTPLKGEFGNPNCIVPGKNGAVFSRKGMVLDRKAFEQMKDEYYAYRGWDVASGLQTRTKLDELGLSDVADGLATQNLVV